MVALEDSFISDEEVEYWYVHHLLPAVVIRVTNC